MRLAALRSAQQLRHLKIKPSQETSEDEDESCERLGLSGSHIFSSAAEPKMIMALKCFSGAFPEHSKQKMISSSFHDFLITTLLTSQKRVSCHSKKSQCKYSLPAKRFSHL